MTCQDAPDLQITEALTAKAAELMAKYGIDRVLLSATEPDTDQPADRKLDIDNPWARIQAHLLCGLASALRCQCVVLPRADPGSRIHMFGFLCTLSSRATVEPYLGRHWRHSGCRHGRWRWGRHAERKYPQICVASGVLLISIEVGPMRMLCVPSSRWRPGAGYDCHAG